MPSSLAPVCTPFRRSVALALNNIHGILTSITGSGIGRDCAMAFAAEGARGVAFADIDLAAAQAAAEESKGQATNLTYRTVVAHVDVSSEDSVQCMVDSVCKEFGRIDYSVNSAGVSPRRNQCPTPTAA